MDVNQQSQSATCLPLFAAWLLALVSTLIVLFVGEVMGQEPCLLCWYQRAFMFPLTIILGIAAARSDFAVWRYALPLAGAGWLLALYHNLLYFAVIPEAIKPCGAGPSCSGADMTVLGALPLPSLSLAAFTLLIILLLTSRRNARP